MSVHLQTILTKLTSEEQDCINAIIQTSMMQAELIKELSYDLQDYTGSSVLQKNALEGASLTKLSELLQKTVVEGPTVGEINTALEEMHLAIENAESSQKALDTAFKFGLKIAPILLL